MYSYWLVMSSEAIEIIFPRGIMKINIDGRVLISTDVVTALSLLDDDTLRLFLMLCDFSIVSIAVWNLLCYTTDNK